MAYETKTQSRSETATAARDKELAPQLWMTITIFFHSPGRNILISLGAALCAVVALTAFGQIKLNAWNEPFYDALSRKDVSGFVYQLVIFGVIAGAVSLECRPGRASRNEQAKISRWIDA